MKILKKILAVLPMLALGFAAGILIGRYAAFAESSGVPGGMIGAIALLFLGYILSMYLQIAVHEGGHLLFGLLTGYRFCSYRLGSFMLVKQDGRMTLRRLKIAGTGGQCLMAPPDWTEDLPVTLYNLGGCLLNLLFSVLCLALWLPLRHHWLGALPLICALAGLGFALTNGIPMRVGGVDNDGRNVLSLRKDPQARRAFWLQMKVVQAQSDGLRLCEMPEDWFRWPESGMDNPLVASIAVFCCNRLLDQARISEARSAIENLLSGKSGMPGLYTNLLTCDLIFCCLLEGDTDSASALLTKPLLSFMKSMKTFPSVIRTAIAVAQLLDKDNGKADTLRKQFEKTARSYPYPQEIDSERELLARLEALA